MDPSKVEIPEEHKAYNYSNGCHYDGNWRANRRHGQGTFKWPGGAIYRCEFKNERRNGPGALTYSDTSSYEGEWRNDMKEGQGTFVWPGGAKYVGQFRDDQMYGMGWYVFLRKMQYKKEYSTVLNLISRSILISQFP